MKYTFVLIATVFLIGITLSDAKTERDKRKAGEGADKYKQSEKNKKTAIKEEETGEEVDEEVDDSSPENNEEDDDDDEDEEKEEERPPKKGLSSKRKPAPKNVDLKLERKLKRLQNQLKSVDTTSLVTALRKTPDDKLKNALPQLQQLSKTLQGTAFGHVMRNLTNLVAETNPEMWHSLFAVFPNFLSNLISTLGQLGSIGVATVGKVGQGVAQAGDAMFDGIQDGLEDVEGVAGSVPGANFLLGMAKQGVGTAHVVTMNPLDAAVGAANRAGQDVNQQLKRTRKTKRQT